MKTKRMRKDQALVIREDMARLRDTVQRCLEYNGPYTLSSGRQSNYYYDGKRETQNPPTAWAIGKALVDVVLDSGAEAVGGLEIGAIPIADAIGMAAHVERGVTLPTFIVRKTAKSHGTRSRVSEANVDDGPHLLREGRRVAIVDDVITTGQSIQQAIDVVLELGCVVTLVVALLERHESERQLEGQDFPVVRLFRTDENGHLSVDDDFVRRAEAASQSRLLSR
jgi:orotate phosphoribosyltransferase